jgi:peptide deformylase
VTLDKLTILLWDDPKLSAICTALEDNEFGPALETFGQQMVAAMDERNGVGLAAPQVGVLQRMFVMRFPDHKNAPPIAVCNPVLVLSGETLQGREGCLSLPEIFQVVERSSHVNMTYREPSGKPVELLLDLWDARVAQHEFDHTLGIMFFDRMSRQMRRTVLREWEKVRKVANVGL